MDWQNTSKINPVSADLLDIDWPESIPQVNNIIRMCKGALRSYSSRGYRSICIFRDSCILNRYIAFDNMSDKIRIDALGFRI